MSTLPKEAAMKMLAPALALLLLAACAASAPSGPPVAPLREQALALFGVVKPVDAAEVQAPAAALGRALFWDTRLSLDGKTACASCHARDDHSADRRRVSINAKGEPTTLHSQPMFMAQDQPVLRWYGDRRDGAHQAERSISGSMGFAAADAIGSTLKQHGYEPAFRAAFPEMAEPVGAATYARALQAYQRTLRTPSRFDAFLQGDDNALSVRERTGLQTFIATGCAGCHNGALLGGNAMQKFGVVKDYWLATGSAKPDLGRFNATKQEADKYVFRVAMLRNIAKTAPYFHDGSVERLEDAVRIMGEVQLGRTLSAQEIGDIVAFLQSLTGEAPAHYAAPARFN
jgi:cytochrome c peroxidase